MDLIAMYRVPRTATTPPTWWWTARPKWRTSYRRQPHARPPSAHMRAGRAARAQTAGENAARAAGDLAGPRERRSHARGLSGGGLRVSPRGPRATQLAARVRRQRHGAAAHRPGVPGEGGAVARLRVGVEARNGGAALREAHAAVQDLVRVPRAAQQDLQQAQRLHARARGVGRALARTPRSGGGALASMTTEFCNTVARLDRITSLIIATVNVTASLQEWTAEQPNSTALLQDSRAPRRASVSRCVCAGAREEARRGARARGARPHEVAEHQGLGDLLHAVGRRCVVLPVARSARALPLRAPGGSMPGDPTLALRAAPAHQALDLLLHRCRSTSAHEQGHVLPTLHDEEARLMPRRRTSARASHDC